jgi:hypothetical protein
MPLVYFGQQYTLGKVYLFFTQKITATFGNPENFRSLPVLKTSVRVTIPALRLSSFAVNAQAAEHVR